MTARRRRRMKKIRQPQQKMSNLFQKIVNYQTNREEIITLYNKLEEIIKTKKEKHNNEDKDNDPQIISKHKKGNIY